MATLPPLWHLLAVHSIVALLPLLGALLLVAGTIVTVVALWHAPLGEESADGFHALEDSSPADRAKAAPKAEPLVGGLA